MGIERIDRPYVLFGWARRPAGFGLTPYVNLGPHQRRRDGEREMPSIRSSCNKALVIACLLFVNLVWVSPIYARVGPAWQETVLKIPTPQGELVGTITIPANVSSMPAVLIVAGSGPTDRDGNDARYGLRTDLYKRLAEDLTKAGIASLRYDKRGVGASTSAEALEVPLVLDTYVQDVVLALQAAEAVRGINSVFLLGHSEGGLLSILAAHQHPPRGLILLESQGRSMAKLISEQLHAAPIADNLKLRADEIMVELQQGRSVTDIPTGLQALFAPNLQAYLKSILSVDPGREIAHLRIPTLIIQGTTDLQTSMQDAQHLHAGNPDATVVVLPGANHVLRDVSADRVPNLATYSKPDLPLDPALLPALVSFIQTHAP